MTILIFFFFHFCSDFFFHFICAQNIDCGYTLKPRDYSHSIFQSKKKKQQQKNNVYPCDCKPMPSGPPSFIFFIPMLHSRVRFSLFLLECIKASFEYIYLSCKCVRFNAKKSMIKFDFTTFIPIFKLIDNDACQVFI